MPGTYVPGSSVVRTGFVLFFWCILARCGSWPVLAGFVSVGFSCFWGGVVFFSDISWFGVKVGGVLCFCMVSIGLTLSFAGIP